MKTWTLLAAAFIAGCLVSVSFGQSKTYEPQTVSKSICRISFEGYTTTPGSSTSSAGSCTVIDSSLVLTAAHVVGQSVATVDCAGDKIRGKVIALDLYHDWALVRLEKPINVKPRSIRETKLTEGETVFAIGYGGQGYGYTRGKYTKGILRGRAVSGDSGGPICDVAGKLIGVIRGYASDGELLHEGKGLAAWVEKNRDNDVMDLGGKR